MTSRLLLAAALLTSALLDAAVLHAQRWPSFRGPAASGVSAVTSVPTRWDVPAGQGVRWRVAIPGLSHASPIAWGDRVYAVSAAPIEGETTIKRDVEGVVFADDQARPHQWTLSAYDRASGRVIWTRVVHTGAPGQARHVRGSYANQTPATDGRFIVVSLGHEGVFGLDMDGQVRWRVPGPPDRSKMFDPASSPIVHDGRAIVQHDWQTGSHLAAYDLESGREQWRIGREEGMTWATPSVLRSGGRDVLVVNSPRWIRAHDPATGAELWRLDNRVQGPWDRVPTPFAAGGLFIVAGGGGERPIYGLRADGTTAWSTGSGSPYLPTPLALDGLLYVMANNGVLSVFDVANGQPVYQQRVAVGAVFSASPVAAGGHVYFTGEDGDVFVVRAGRRFELVASNPVGDVIFATPAVVEGGLVFRTLRQLLLVGSP